MIVKTKGIFSTEHADILEKVDLVINNDRIVDLTSNVTSYTDNAEILDLSQYYVFPGFVDAHSHITIRPGDGNQLDQFKFPIARQVLRGVKNLKDDLSSGVTTMRVLAEENYLDVEFKEAIERCEISGPRLKVATRGLTASHGHGRVNRGFDGPEEIREAIRENIAAGADVIKLFITGGISSPGGDINAFTYTHEEISVAVEEAHLAGKSVAVHAHGGKGVDLCVQIGVDSIEHGGYLTESNVRGMAEKGTWLVATNAILFHPEGIEKGDKDNPIIWEKVLNARTAVQNSFLKAMEAKVPLALGTDSMHGLFPFEVEWAAGHDLVGAKRAFIAATLGGAELLNMDHLIGSLTPGKKADFVAFKENPLENIKAVYDAFWVVKDGLVYKADGKEVNN